MKRFAGISCVLGIMILMSACGHEHVWQEATCTEPRTCTECGATEGEPLGHTWQEATCVTRKLCTRCGETVGKPLGNGHTVKEWKVTQKPTCAKEGLKRGVCTRCGETVEEVLPKTEHTPGEWKVTKEATKEGPGEQSQVCSVCGAVLKTEEFTLTPEELEQNYKEKCQAYSYETIARNPDQYIGTDARYTGEVFQVIEEDNQYQLMVNLAAKKYDVENIFVVYHRGLQEPRILEDDTVTIYGRNANTISYESKGGDSITIPCVYAEYIDIH